MSKEKGSTKRRRGFGLGFILTVVFVVLKLTSVVAWSWWIVFLPLLISLGIRIVFTIIAIIAAYSLARKG